jgi:type IV secretory pathway TraG/TraD family ATPase VirD4
MGVARARASAAQTRPGLTASQRKHAPVEQIGLPLGTSTSGEPVVLPLEDHAVVVATTGAGKSRVVMIPAALSAPGGLVLTCTRPDILDVVATRRGGLGRLWVFDPLDRLGWPEPMVWDPVAGCRHGETALARGLAFAAGLGADDRGSTNAGFFRANAASALTRLLHAADLDGRPIAELGSNHSSGSWAKPLSVTVSRVPDAVGSRANST